MGGGIGIKIVFLDILWVATGHVSKCNCNTNGCFNCAVRCILLDWSSSGVFSSVSAVAPVVPFPLLNSKVFDLWAEYLHKLPEVLWFHPEIALHVGGTKLVHDALYISSLSNDCLSPHTLISALAYMLGDCNHSQ